MSEEAKLASPMPSFFMLTGDAANTDPVCDLSPLHHIVTNAVKEANTPTEKVQDIIFGNARESRKLKPQ